ncbi:MAG: TolC family protein, partial [Pseudomonadota bacterium]
LIAFASAVLLLAGTVKGFIGLGMPTVALTLLTLQELEALLLGEFELEVIEYRTGWSEQEVFEVMDEIYADDEIDVLLVLGFAANQRAIVREGYGKPTFLPFVVESRIIGAPLENGTSGKRNLNYLTYSTQFLESIDVLRDVVDFSSIAILSDENLFASLPQDLQLQLNEPYNGVLIDAVPHDGSDNSMIDLIPETSEAVIIGLLPRMSEATLQQLIDDLKRKKIPSFSYLGKGLVQQGILATAMNDSVYQLAARRNALNIQAVLLGETANSQPVMVESRPRLLINQETAEEIGVAIDFRTLIYADVVGFGEGLDADRYDIQRVAAESIKNNLELLTQRFSTDIQRQQRARARSALLPQISANASYLERKDDTAIVQSGFANADSTDINLSASQTLFSDSVFANNKIQGFLTEASEAELLESELDTIRIATLAMADVLQARAEAAINQENLGFSERNLELAVDRVGLGATSLADQYRWETQTANARSAVFSAFSTLLIAEQNLNRVLNREITQPIQVTEVDMDQISLFTVPEIFQLMDNADTFERLYQLGLEDAYDNSPELSRSDLLIEAKQRELTSLKRQGWLPEIGLSAQVSDNIDNANMSAGSGEDWQVMVSASVPLFQGGGLKAQQRAAKLELEQLQTQRELTRDLLAQQLRTSMNNVLTALFNLEFTRRAQTAAVKSLDLVTDSYNQGAVSIVDLLDSQNASVSASLSAVQANVAFFRASVEMQRTLGEFDFLLSKEERLRLREVYFEQFNELKGLPKNYRPPNIDNF